MELRGKLKKVTEALATWSRRRLSKASRQIEALKQQLTKQMNDRPRTYSWELAQNITNKIEKLKAPRRNALGFEVNNQLVEMGS